MNVPIGNPYSQPEERLVWWTDFVRVGSPLRQSVAPGLSKFTRLTAAPTAAAGIACLSTFAEFS
jgi:hypothetical protein